MTLEARQDAPASPRPRRWGWILLILGLAVIPLAAVKYAFIDNKPSDLFFAAISRLDGDYTIYSDGYRESAFRSLEIGMTAKEVEAVLGRPLNVGKWQETVPGQPITAGEGPLHDLWRYAKASKNLGDYWRREVWFKAGVVHRVVGGFYLD